MSKTPLRNILIILKREKGAQLFKMPKVSIKRRLIKSICEFSAIQILNSTSFKEEIKILDDAQAQLTLLCSKRYAIIRQPLPKSVQWFVNILPEYDDHRFKGFMRVSRQNFGFILSLIENSEEFKGPKSHTQMPIEKQLAVTLYKLGFDGTVASLSNVAGIFGIGDGGTTMEIVTRVINAIINLQHNWIMWPCEEERQQMQTYMADKLPKCIGFVDGSHITLDEAPLDDPESYFTRKQRYAIHLQAICDTNRRIRNIVVGYPGSVHDARVFANLSIGQNPEVFLTNGEWIAGDSAYGVTQYVLTPFRSNSSTRTARQRKQFNKYFSSFRVHIECTFGIMKEIFGSLKGLRIRVDRAKGHQLACNWIRACCILYNIILPSICVDDSDNFMNDDEDEEELEERLHDTLGDAKRMALFTFINTKLG